MSLNVYNVYSCIGCWGLKLVDPSFFFVICFAALLRTTWAFQDGILQVVSGLHSTSTTSQLAKVVEFYPWCYFPEYEDSKGSRLYFGQLIYAYHHFGEAPYTSNPPWWWPMRKTGVFRIIVIQRINTIHRATTVLRHQRIAFTDLSHVWRYGKPNCNCMLDQLISSNHVVHWRQCHSLGYPQHCFDTLAFSTLLSSSKHGQGFQVFPIIWVRTSSFEGFLK